MEKQYRWASPYQPLTSIYSLVGECSFIAQIQPPLVITKAFVHGEYLLQIMATP